MILTATIRSPHAVLFGALLLVCAQAAAPVHAAIQTQPSSLNPGDQYRLVFVTSTGANPTSASINDYNAFVSNHASAVPALAALGAEWKAIGSTQSVNARQNTGTDPTPAGPTGVPIFLLNDTLFAANYDDLWDGSPVGTTINITELGLPLSQLNQTLNNGWVWTGSTNAGFGFSGRELGAFASAIAFGDAAPEGGSDAPSGLDGWMLDDVAHPSHIFSFYAISSVLTVPGTPGVVPESTSIVAWGGLAMTALIGRVARRKRND